MTVSQAQDADLRFQALIGEPTAAITLVTAVVLTAIIWISTFLLTVSSVAAYVSQVSAAPTTGEPLHFESSSPALPLSAPTITASQDKNLPIDEPLPTRSNAPPIAGTKQTVIVSAPPPLPADQSTLPPALATQVADGRAETVAMAMTPARATQDGGTSTEQVVVAANNVPRPAPAETPCGDGLWGNVCRERMRWSHCHPDKWDTVPECTVQKFENALQ